MLTKWDLRKDESSLDMLISVISSVLSQEKLSVTPAGSRLVKEMQEALDELRRKRGMHRLLVAIEQSRIAPKRAARRTSH